jgi:hypothetical protein
LKSSICITQIIKITLITVYVIEASQFDNWAYNNGDTEGNNVVCYTRKTGEREVVFSNLEVHGDIKLITMKIIHIVISNCKIGKLMVDSPKIFKSLTIKDGSKIESKIVSFSNWNDGSISLFKDLFSYAP